MGKPNEDPVLRTISSEQYWARLQDIQAEIEETLFQIGNRITEKITFAELQTINARLREVLK